MQPSRTNETSTYFYESFEEYDQKLNALSEQVAQIKEISSSTIQAHEEFHYALLNINRKERKATRKFLFKTLPLIMVTSFAIGFFLSLREPNSFLREKLLEKFLDLKESFLFSKNY